MSSVGVAQKRQRVPVGEPGGGSLADPARDRPRQARAPAALDTATPVLILGGKENGLSLVRRFGALGITVRVSGPTNCWGMYSRFCAERFRVPPRQSARAFWRALLLSPTEARLNGHIVLACSDEAIEFVCEHRNELATRYILDEADPHLQNALLDKKQTLELARAIGVPTPNFWRIRSEADLAAIRAEVTFPVVLKPIHSHKFARVFGRKLFIVEDGLAALAQKVRLVQSQGLEVMLMEMIPGPDAQLSSYYTYMDADGRSLFQFTKRIIRRFPVNRGGACYHITEWLPETAELGRKFFETIKFRGLGNVEFKRDVRDGMLKLIEVNARFTAAQELLVRAGAPLDLVVYAHLTGQAVPEFNGYTQLLRFWYPARDFLAFLDLRRRGELSFFGWLKSVLPYRHVSPLWNIRDPMASLGAAYAALHRALRGPG